MFVKFTAIKLKCDRCGAIYDNADGIEHWRIPGNENDLEWEAKEYACWEEIDGKHYCNDCWEYDENDEAVVPQEVK